MNNNFINLTQCVKATAEANEQRIIELMKSGEYKDEVLKRHSTDTRWTQYINNQITREKAIEFASKRIKKDTEKTIKKHTYRLLQADNSYNIVDFDIMITWKKSNMWGYNPTANIYATDEKGILHTATGTCSGCGYDKLSTAVCNALNQIPGILKNLYRVKEESLTDIPTEYNHSNKDYICYGAGYGAIPYFEGGCGINCTINCLEKAGYKVRFIDDKLLTGTFKEV